MPKNFVTELPELLGKKIRYASLTDAMNPLDSVRAGHGGSAVLFKEVPMDGYMEGARMILLLPHSEEMIFNLRSIQRADKSGNQALGFVTTQPTRPTSIPGSSPAGNGKPWLH